MSIHSRIIRLMLFTVGLLVVTLVVTLAVTIPSRPRLTMLDVGQGDALLIQTKEGRQILLDGGPDTSVLGELQRELPFFDRYLDVVILSHAHEDHFMGLKSVVMNYEVGLYIDAVYDEAGADYDELQELLTSHGVRVVHLSADGVLDLGDGTRLVFALPVDPSATEASLMMELRFDDTCRALFTGDATAAEERAWLGRGERTHCSVLKVAHHGSAYGTTDELLAAVTPAAALISVGQDNSYGHPSLETLERLGNIPLYRTDSDGPVCLRLTVEPVTRCPASPFKLR